MQLGNGKARNVAIIIWKEELDKLGKSYYDYLAFLEGLALLAVASPLHDKDRYTAEDVRKWVKRKENELGVEALYNSETGELLPVWSNIVPKVGDRKKAHIHTLIRVPGPRSAQYFCDLFADFGFEIGRWRWEKVEHVDSMIRYFAHLDQPDKAEYSAFDIVGFGGIDLSCLVRNDTNSKLKVLCEVQEQCIKKKINSYHVLCKWAFASRDLDYINCVTGRASYWVGYFNSIARDEARKAAARKAAEKAKQMA